MKGKLKRQLSYLYGEKKKNIYLSMNAEEKNTLKTLIEGFK